jgi:hypothetical protein
MYVHQWNLRIENRGTHFAYEDFVLSLDFEWQYRYDTAGQVAQIGIIGWPDKEECVIWQIMKERKKLELIERVAPESGLTEITLHTTTTKKKGRIDAQTAGIHEVSGLISFMKHHEHVHIYHASQFHSGEDPRILVFDAKHPDEGVYEHVHKVPVKTKGKGFYPTLLTGIIHVLTPYKK